MSLKPLAWTSAPVYLGLALAQFAQDSKTIPPPADRDPFVGVWRANSDKSRPKLNGTERSYTRTIGRISEQIVFSSTGGASKAKIREYRIRCDGLFYPLPTGPVLSCRWLNSSRVEGETRDDPNGRTTYWAREVTPDGQTMTITEFKDKARTKVASVMILDRVK